MTAKVVSLLPLPLERDSRALKIAASLARLGYDSVVVESLASERPETLPVPVVPLSRAATRPAAAASTQSGGGRLGVLRRLLPRGASERLHLLAMLAGYFLLRPLQGLMKAPRGDVYYLHEYRLFPLVRALQWLKPAPVIYDAHDFYPEVWRRSELSPFWLRTFLPLLGRWEAWVARRADAVVMVGEGVAALFEQAYGVRPLVLRNAHDTRLERPPKMTLRQAAGVTDGDFLLVSVGNRKPGMAVEQAIAALADLPAHVHLALVGRFHEPALDAAARAGVMGRVHVVGAVAPEEVVPFVRSADAALVLYWPETGNYGNILPNGFFQSIAAGLPLLWPPLADLDRVADGHEIGRHLDPRQPGSIVSGVNWLIDNPDAREYARSEAVRLAQSIGWEREEEKLGRLVRAVMDRTGT